MATKDYYHYTNEDGLDKIQESGYIKESKTTSMDAGDDALYGTGVYLTTVPPTAGRTEIEETCWGLGTLEILDQLDKLDYFIYIKIPPSETGDAVKKDVYVYSGDLVLNNYEWDSGKVPN